MSDLPRPPSPLVGRAQQLDAIASRLRAHPIVSLVGPPGVGKSALAKAVAQSWTAAGHEVAFVSAEASGLAGVREALQRGDQAALVVVDDIDEEVAAIAALLSRLRASPILVTSDETLRIEGETVERIAGLAANDARSLLVRNRYDWCEPSEDDAAVDALLDALGGNPLAIERAREALGVMSCRALLAREREWASLLQSQRRDVPARQRSLAQRLERSVGRLSPRGRDALTRLAQATPATLLPFPFSRDDITYLLEGDGVDAVLLELVHHQWVERLAGERSADAGMAPSGAAQGAEGQHGSVRHTRFALPPFWGRVVLHSMPAQPDAPKRQRSWYAHILERGTAAAERLELTGKLTALLDELPSIEQVARHGDLDERLRARTLMARAALIQGSAQDAAQALSAAVEDARATQSPADGALREALLVASETHQVAGNLDAAETFVHQYTQGAPGSARALERARGLLATARIKNARGLWQDAAKLAQQAAELALEENALTLASACLLERAACGYVHEDVEIIRPIFTRALELATIAGQQRLVARALGGLAFMAYDWGETRKARVLYGQAYDNFVALGDARFAAYQLAYLGNVYRHEGDQRQAQEHYMRAIDQLESKGDGMYKGVFLMDLGASYLLDDQSLPALAALERARETLGDARRGQIDLFLGGYLATALALVGRTRAAVEVLDALPPVREGHGLQAITLHREIVRLLAGERPKRPAGLRRLEEDPRVTSHERVALQLLARARMHARGDGLSYDATGFFDREGNHVPLSGSNLLLFKALVAARHSHPGRALATMELCERAWPGERVLAESAKNRVRVAIAKLRSLGLGDKLESRDGYLLRPEVPLRELSA